MYDYNSPWPSDMLKRYKNLKVMAGGSAVTVSVNRYRNNDAKSHPSPDGGGTQNALKVKNALLGLNYTDVVARAGGALDYVNVFTGKGSPEAIKAVLETFANYADKFVAKYGNRTYEADYAVKLTADLLGDPALSWQDTLQAITDEFIGLDCNGFAGNWLKKADVGLKLTEQSDPGTVRRAAKTKRMHLDEIDEWDVVIWQNNSHIAVIERPTWPRSSKFWMCQSAGDGPTMQEYVFTESAPGLFTKTGGANPRSEVGGNVEVFSVW